MERELVNMLAGLGYSVMRAAGSGVNSLSPDIIAIKSQKGYAFECKAWNRGSLSIELSRFEALQKWESNTGMATMVAWRLAGESWLFIPLEGFSKNSTCYSVTKKHALEKGIPIDKLFGIGSKPK